MCVCASVTWSCPTLQSHGLQPARLFRPWDSTGKSTGVGSLSLLQGIFLTQGSNPGLLHCRQIFYHLSYREVPRCYIGNLKIQHAFPTSSDSYPPKYYRFSKLLNLSTQLVLWQKSIPKGQKEYNLNVISALTLVDLFWSPSLKINILK